MCCTALDRFCLGTVSFEDPISLALYSNDCMGNSIFKYYLTLYVMRCDSFSLHIILLCRCSEKIQLGHGLSVPVTAELALSMVFRGTSP